MILYSNPLKHVYKPLTIDYYFFLQYDRSTQPPFVVPQLPSFAEQEDTYPHVHPPDTTFMVIMIVLPFDKQPSCE